MELLATLVIAAQAGDREAFAEVTRRFRGNAHARAYAVLRDHQLAEDAVQEAFAEAFLNLDKLRESAAFPGWFKRIVIKRFTGCSMRSRTASIKRAARSVTRRCTARLLRATGTLHGSCSTAARR